MEVQGLRVNQLLQTGLQPIAGPSHPPGLPARKTMYIPTKKEMYTGMTMVTGKRTTVKTGKMPSLKLRTEPLNQKPRTVPVDLTGRKWKIKVLPAREELKI